MSKIVKYCKKCFEEPEKYIEHIKSVTGYYTPNENQNMIFCPNHQTEKLNDSNLSIDEYNIICNISTDLQFVASMIELKEKDPIEYQLKLSQFKANLSQTKAVEENNVPKCPYCHSTNIKKITNTSKVVNTALFGIFGQKRKHQWHCNNCNSDF